MKAIEEPFCIPVKYLEDKKEPLIQWYKCDDLPFSEPFFDESINRLRFTFAENQSRNPRCISSPEYLLNIPQVDGDPDAIVFHVSRCGSTLLSQLLGLHPELCSLAEVPLLDALLANSPRFSESDAKRLYRSTVNLLRRSHKHLLLKLDSWHLFHYERIRSYYPNVPIILLYRNPYEVWTSQQKNPGMHAPAGLLSEAQLNFYLNGNDFLDDPRQYMAALMTAYFNRMVDIFNKDSNAIFLDYRDGVLPMVMKSAEHAGIQLNAELIEAIEQRSKRHAKKPQELFTTEQEPSPVPEFLNESLELYLQLRNMVSEIQLKT